ncbi:MAG: hypothetical protein NTX55_00960, partial [Candidatus Parcubacteria bacterium]|nr:hypothetical protein [Candidatus Parcubacteria bacterium]
QVLDLGDLSSFNYESNYWNYPSWLNAAHNDYSCYTQEYANMGDVTICSGQLKITYSITTTSLAAGVYDTQDYVNKDICTTPGCDSNAIFINVRYVITEPVTPPQCSDGVDNDGDGKIDAADPDCHAGGNPSNPYVAIIDDEKTSNYTLSVSKSGSGSGTVTSNPAGITCGADCSESYSSGASITLTASPSGGSVFAGWSGDCSGASSCALIMNLAKNVIATFNASTPSPDFTLNSSGSIIATVVSGGPAKTSSNTTITLTPANEFSDNITLSASSDISGATYNFTTNNPLTSSKYSTGSVFNITIPSTTTRGQHTIVIRGADGGLVRTVNVILNVESYNPGWQEF